MYLPVIQVDLSEQELTKMNRDVWSGEFVDASLLNGSEAEPVKMRYRGGHSREYPKKSYEIRRASDTIHLNAEYDDPSMLRNALSFRFIDSIGVPSPSARHCLFQINGEDRGIYLEIEGVEDSFFRRRHLPCRALMYAGNNDANFSLLYPDTQKLKKSLFDGYELVIGDETDVKRLEKFIFSVNTPESADLYEYLQETLDIENYLKWIAGAVCTSNYDGFEQNYAIYQDVVDGTYRMIPWDYEGTWGRNCFGERCSSKSVRMSGYNILTRKIMQIPNLRKRYQQMMNEILEHSFTVSALTHEIEQMTANIRAGMANDKTRKYSLAMFDKEPALIRSYIRNRRTFLLKELTTL